jgi:hypothetical protein
MDLAAFGSLRRNLVRLGALAVAALVAGSASAGTRSAQITAVVGDTHDLDGAPTETGSVSENERIITGEDGKCSMLVDENVVVQVCERSSATLKRDPETGNLIVQVDAGRVQVIAEPRLADERVEIHTPAAIATLLGTIVHVQVDPATKASTISLTHNAAQVRSTDPRFPQSTRVHTAEQVTLKPGEPVPAKARRMRPQDIDRLQPCTVALREGARHRDQAKTEADTLVVWAEEEGDRVRDLTDSGDDQPPASPPPLFDGGDDLNDVCTPLDCGGIPTRGRINPQFLSDSVLVSQP